MKNLRQIDFNKTPFVAIWETTQACDLACRHCRAEAIDWRDPRELTTEEGFRVLEEIKSMGTPIAVLSGGDPAKREDLFDLVEYGSRLGLRMATIPAATSRLTFDLVKKLKESGLDQMALSLDGPTADIHDSFRGVPGAFDTTIDGAHYAHLVNLPLQINTTFSQYNFDYFDDIARLVSDLDVVFWEVFFLVPMGRGRELKAMTAQQYEEIFCKLYYFSKKVNFIVKITEAPHYRRYVVQREMEKRDNDLKSSGEIKLPGHMTRDFGPGNSIGQAPKGVNSGNGFVFISHTGEVYPSGFLPLSGGNVKNCSLEQIYRDSPLFNQIRDYSQLKGKCGICEFKDICGGSRARTYAVTGDCMKSDPNCAYMPKPSVRV